jgi:hypothetical protein
VEGNGIQRGIVLFADLLVTTDNKISRAKRNEAGIFPIPASDSFSFQDTVVK